MNSLEVMLTCLSFSEDPERRDKLEQVTEDIWHEVMAKCDYHRTGPYVYHRLKEMKVAISLEIEKAFKKELLKAVYRSENLYFCLGAILREFEKKAIPAVALKGAYLAELVYDHRALRYMSDIDLLVKKEDLNRSVSVLTELGYKKKEKKVIGSILEYHSAFKKCYNPIVELHWNLSIPYAVSKVDMQGILTRAQRVRIANCPSLTLCPEDLIIYLCLHMSCHVISATLQMLADIGEIVQKMGKEIDWDALQARARQWELHRAVYAVLYLAKDLLGVNIPEKTLKDLWPGEDELGYVAFLRNRLTDYQKQMPLKSINLRDSLDLLEKILINKRERISLIHDVSVNSCKAWWYFFFSFFRLFYNKGRGILRYFSGSQKHRKSENIIRLESYAVQNWLLMGKKSGISITKAEYLKDKQK